LALFDLFDSVIVGSVSSVIMFWVLNGRWLGTSCLGLAHSVRRPSGRTGTCVTNGTGRRWNTEHSPSF
jgi:hypothetical protein